MSTTQAPIYLNQTEACLGVAMAIARGDEVSKAFFCPKKEKLTDCLEDAAATYRLRKGVDAQYCVANRATAEGMAMQTTGITVFVGSNDWPRDREFFLGRCEP